MMLGGVICGYCASGKLKAATAPARVMTIDSTAAEIGGRIKKCENTRSPQRTENRGQRTERKLLFRPLFSVLCPSILRWRFRRRLRRHLNLGLRLHSLHPADDDAVLGGDALLDHPQ